MLIHPDRLFSADPAGQNIATMDESVRSLSLLSPHGYPHAAWFAANQSFPDPAQHYSQGIAFADLGIRLPPMEKAA